MKFLAVLVISGFINVQQPLQNNQQTQNSHNEQLSALAIDYLKFRYSDADFIQSAGATTFDGSHHHVYVVFSSESTSIDHCIIHINDDKKNPKIEHITCMDYNTKLGFKEKVNPIIKD